MLARVPAAKPLTDALVALAGTAVALARRCGLLDLDRLRRHTVAGGVHAILGCERALLVRIGFAVVPIGVVLVAVGPIRVRVCALVVHLRPVGVHLGLGVRDVRGGALLLCRLALRLVGERALLARPGPLSGGLGQLRVPFGIGVVLGRERLGALFVHTGAFLGRPGAFD